MSVPRVAPMGEIPEGVCGFVAVLDDLTMICVLDPGHGGLHSIERKQRGEFTNVRAANGLDPHKYHDSFSREIHAYYHWKISVDKR